MLNISKDQMKALQSQVAVMQQKHEELKQAVRIANEPLKDCGMFGQASEYDIVCAENAEMMLKHWEDEHLADMQHKIAFLPKAFCKHHVSI